MIDKEDIVQSLRTERYGELLMWNGENFWNSKQRVLVQGNTNELIHAFNKLSSLYDFCDLGYELSKVSID